MIQYLYIAAGFSARGGFNKKQYPPAARAVEKGTKRFMKWVYKLERKFGRICIPHLMLVIIAGQAMVYLANLLNPDILLLSRFSLNWAAVMHGEVWRLFTFVFIPQSTSPLGLVLTLYFYYLIGNTLENTWGDFQFNVYYLCGMLGAILAAALTGYGTSYYINLSLFFAFAMLYPDFQVLLFFIIPIRAWIFALFDLAVILIGLFQTPFTAYNLFPLVALGNYFLFFGKDVLNVVPLSWQNKLRKAFHKAPKQQPKIIHFHVTEQPNASEMKRAGTIVRFWMIWAG